MYHPAISKSLQEGEGGGVLFSVCETALDDWTNGGSVDVFFTYDEYGFIALFFLDLRTKLCCIASGK